MMIDNREKHTATDTLLSLSLPLGNLDVGYCLMRHDGSSSLARLVQNDREMTVSKDLVDRWLVDGGGPLKKVC